MNKSLVVLVALLIGLRSNGACQKPDEKLIKPAPGQLQAAKEAFTKVGGELSDRFKPVHVFAMTKTATDEDIRKLPSLPFSFGLELSETKITDAGLKELSNLTNLTSLSIRRTNVRDTGLKDIANLKNLTDLDLSDTKVTDAGLKHIANLKSSRSWASGGLYITEGARTGSATNTGALAFL